MSGRDKSAESAQRQIAAQQQAQSTQQIDASNARIAKADSLTDPAIKFYQSLLSGDPNTVNSALSVPLAELKKSQTATEGQIMEGMGEGPARDFALMAAKRDANSNVFNVKNQAINDSYGKLASMGSTETATALQQLGAGSRFGEAASTTNNALMDQAAKRKAATMGAIGQAAGLAGTIATSGMGGGGGKSATPKGTGR